MKKKVEIKMGRQNFLDFYEEFLENELKRVF